MIEMTYKLCKLFEYRSVIVFHHRILDIVRSKQQVRTHRNSNRARDYYEPERKARRILEVQWASLPRPLFSAENEPKCDPDEQSFFYVQGVSSL